MNWQQKEIEILSLIKNIFQEIITENPHLPIRAESRAGAEISNFLEDKFVAKTKKHNKIVESASAPKQQTKNPYDIYFIYEFSPNDQELVWLDIKATKATAKDSNPDMGTYKKFIKFFQDGNYFAVYCQLAYIPEQNGLKFVETPQGEMTHIFLLKDIHHSFRIQPNNQLQVNYAVNIEPRNLLDFIDLLSKKLQESLERKQKKIEQEKKQLSEQFNNLKQSVQKTLLR